MLKEKTIVNLAFLKEKNKISTLHFIYRDIILDSMTCALSNQGPANAC